MIRKPTVLAWCLLLLLVVSERAEAGATVPYFPFGIISNPFNPIARDPANYVPPPSGLTKPVDERLRPDQIPVIFIHGIASTLEIWQGIQNTLARGKSFKAYSFSYDTSLGID